MENEKIKRNGQKKIKQWRNARSHDMRSDFDGRIYLNQEQCWKFIPFFDDTQRKRLPSVWCVFSGFVPFVPGNKGNKKNYF